MLVLWGSIVRPGARNRELIWLVAVSSALTAAIFAFTPAIGRVGHWNRDFIDRIMEIFYSADKSR